MDRSDEVLRFLDGAGIPYQLLRHAPVATIADCLAYPEISAPGNAIARNLFLCNRQGTEFFLLLLPPLSPFRTAAV
ncbi:MAG TPA: prolyl-tRNA synthetase associated domain-containing protein, partial [Candidatus Limnocylindria bacterium]|nr:prolyl-tRNA synthetase associated domain-containing protein [Candidatus Limnocylindria bacterium]